MSVLLLAAGAGQSCAARAAATIQLGLYSFWSLVLTLKRALVRTMQQARVPADDARACEKLREYTTLMQVRCGGIQQVFA